MSYRPTLLVIVIVIVIVISKLLKRYSKAKRTRAPAYSRALRRFKEGFQRGVKRSSGPISRVPEGDSVAVRVGVVEMGRGKGRKRRNGMVRGWCRCLASMILDSFII